MGPDQDPRDVQARHGGVTSTFRFSTLWTAYRSTRTAAPPDQPARPSVETEPGQCVSSVSTSTEDAVAVERTVQKAVLMPQRDQDGCVRLL
eukprot:2128790-Prymnesium_polylepis.1